MVGSVSGGCVEDDLIDKVRAGEVAQGAADRRYGVTNEEATRWGLPCGGTLELVMEPVSRAERLGELLETASQQRARAPRARHGQRRGELEPAGQHRRLVLTSTPG